MWKKIEQLIAEKDTTMYAVSKKAGIGQNVLISLKAGRTKRLYFDTVCKLADALDVSLDDFRKGWGVLQWTLEAMRINKGLTQLELAEKFEVSSQTIARLEKDSSDIGYQLLKKYMDYFNVKFDDIFLGKKYENFVNQPN